MFDFFAPGDWVIAQSGMYSGSKGIVVEVDDDGWVLVDFEYGEDWVEEGELCLIPS